MRFSFALQLSRSLQWSGTNFPNSPRARLIFSTEFAVPDLRWARKARLIAEACLQKCSLTTDRRLSRQGSQNSPYDALTEKEKKKTTQIWASVYLPRERGTLLYRRNRRIFCSWFASRKRDFAVPPEEANILFFVEFGPEGGMLTYWWCHERHLLLNWIFDLVREAKCEIGSPWKASKILRWKPLLNMEYVEEKRKWWNKLCEKGVAGGRREHFRLTHFPLEPQWQSSMVCLKSRCSIMMSSGCTSVSCRSLPHFTRLKSTAGCLF